jgi:hypothetical protein
MEMPDKARAIFGFTYIFQKDIFYRNIPPLWHASRIVDREIWGDLVS